MAVPGVKITGESPDARNVSRTGGIGADVAGESKGNPVNRTCGGQDGFVAANQAGKRPMTPSGEKKETFLPLAKACGVSARVITGMCNFSRAKRAPKAKRDARTTVLAGRGRAEISCKVGRMMGRMRPRKKTLNPFR